MIAVLGFKPCDFLWMDTLTQLAYCCIDNKATVGILVYELISGIKRILCCIFFSVFCIYRKKGCTRGGTRSSVELDSEG